ncbi:MAG: ATP-dependent helicase [Bacillota bacterium]|nr:MAG: ATP-dependent helicase [Bacillota bacterium]
MPLTLSQVLEQLRTDPAWVAGIQAWEVEPAQPGRFAPPPPALDGRLVHWLRRRGIDRLYSHQAEAVAASLAGDDVVVVTPTASGKTLCYTLPVLQRMLERPSSRALFLFPTKALAQDQYAALQQAIDELGLDLKAYTYDGDTPEAARRAIRAAGQVVITNPDMLHAGILPYHTRWVNLFENLEYVVVDELHHYRGVFGSHVANVLRRLFRICAFYGSRPRVVACSATIANPGEHARRLLGRPVRVIAESGAPRGERHLIVYNPPVVNAQLGIRRGVLQEARRWAERFLKNGIPTIVFARTRLAVEVLLTYLRHAMGDRSERVRGYRGGYLPNQRREIERGLRSGEVLGVVATNALELGIDIGSLQAAVLAGYPGSVASFWQQAGRAGRRQEAAVAVLVASSSPLDQYIARHPRFLLEQPVEAAFIHPDNLYILVSHIQCAAFELPFRAGERFGDQPVDDVLTFLEEQGLVHRSGDRWHWISDTFPAHEISLRSAAEENVVIIDTSRGARVIGEVDRFSAPLLVHEQAIYIHEGEQYQVERLDFAENKAYVRPVRVDYYTDAHLAVDLKVLDCFASRPVPGGEASRGEVAVIARATLFKKIKLFTHENVGWGRIHLPELEMHTTACWVTLADEPAGMEPAVLQAGLQGLAYLLGHLAPLYLLCDRRDLGTVAQLRSPFTGRPTLFLYDAYPGGVGLAEKAYDILPLLWQAAAEAVAACPCEAGCPACTGPETESGPGAKAAARRLLALLAPPQAMAPPAGRRWAALPSPPAAGSLPAPLPPGPGAVRGEGERR